MENNTKNQQGEPLNGYKAFYRGKNAEFYAATTRAAQLLAAAHFKVKKKDEHMISVILCEKGGEQVTHTPDF